MDGLPLTPFDLVVLGVVALSALLALARGATVEVLAIASWVGAFAIAYYGFGEARAVLARTIDNDLVADGLALVIVFVVPLVAFKAATVALTRRVQGSRLGRWDRAAGAAFGLARGALIVCLLYLALSLAIDPGEHPRWVKEARTLPFVQQGVAALHGLVPGDLGGRGPALADGAPERRDDGLRGAAEAARWVVGPPPEADGGGEREGLGYDAPEREAMDELHRRGDQEPPPRQQGDADG